MARTKSGVRRPASAAKPSIEPSDCQFRLLESAPQVCALRLSGPSRSIASWVASCMTSHEPHLKNSRQDSRWPDSVPRTNWCARLIDSNASIQKLRSREVANWQRGVAFGAAGVGFGCPSGQKGKPTMTEPSDDPKSLGNRLGKEIRDLLTRPLTPEDIALAQQELRERPWNRKHEPGDARIEVREQTPPPKE